MSIGTLALRSVVGGVFVAHGLQKLTGAFGGPGLEGTEKMMDAQEMRPTGFNARLVALTETLGGAALVAGVATPIAAAGLIGVMSTAILKVHAKNGLFNSNGGYEFNAVLIAAVTAIVSEGPGVASIDAIAGKRKWGIGWGIGALAAGVASAYGAIELGKRGVDPDPEPDAA